MRITVERLASLSLTTGTIVALLLWIAWGIILNGLDAFYAGFQSMDTTVLREWLMNRPGPLLLKVWFVGLCSIMILLGLNLVFCSWTRFFSILRARFDASRFLMLVVHLLFGLVALGHLGGFMLGYRHEDLRLGEGDAFRTRDGHEIRVEAIQRAGDPRVSSPPESRAPAQGRARETNFAEISISRNGKVLHRDRAYSLAPVRYQDVQVTLKGLVTAPRTTGRQEVSTPTQEGFFVISKSPGLRLFLFLYPLMILGITLYLVMTWRKTTQRNMNVNLPRKENNTHEAHNRKNDIVIDSPVPAHTLH